MQSFYGKNKELNFQWQLDLQLGLKEKARWLFQEKDEQNKWFRRGNIQY